MTTYAEATDAAAQVLVDALADLDALTPREAAIAAGARTDSEIDRLAAKVTDLRQGPPIARPLHGAHDTDRNRTARPDSPTCP